MFRIAAVRSMGLKRGAGHGGFIDSVIDAVDGFYADTVQNLRAWAPKAPQLPAGSATQSAGIDLKVPTRDLASGREHPVLRGRTCGRP